MRKLLARLYNAGRVVAAGVALLWCILFVQREIGISRRYGHWRICIEYDLYIPINLQLSVHLRLKQLCIGIPFFVFLVEYK